MATQLAEKRKKPGESFLRKVVDVNAWYNRIEAEFGVALLFAMLICMTFQIVQRFIFSGGNTWSEEISRYMYIWFTLITVSYAILHNAHIKVDACMAVFPKKIRPAVVVLGLVVIIIYCGFMVKFGIDMVNLNFAMGNISLGLKLPMGAIYTITPLSHVLIGIRCIQRLIMIYLGNDIKEVDEAEEAIKAAQERETLDESAAVEASTEKQE